MAPEARVLSFVHHTHAAAAKPASYDIVREGLPDYGFHDSRTGMNSSCKTNTGQGNSGAARAIHLRVPLATSDPMDTICGALLAVVDSSAISPRSLGVEAVE